jgi:hypothetical protein
MRVLIVLAYEPSGLIGKNTRTSFERPDKRAPIRACADAGFRARPPPDISKGSNGDISIWRTHWNSKMGPAPALNFARPLCVVQGYC